MVSAGDVQLKERFWATATAPAAGRATLLADMVAAVARAADAGVRSALAADVLPHWLGSSSEATRRIAYRRMLPVLADSIGAERCVALCEAAAAFSNVDGVEFAVCAGETIFAGADGGRAAKASGVLWDCVLDTFVGVAQDALLVRKCQYVLKRAAFDGEPEAAGGRFSLANRPLWSAFFNLAAVLELFPVVLVRDAWPRMGNLVWTESFPAPFATAILTRIVANHPNFHARDFCLLEVLDLGQPGARRPAFMTGEFVFHTLLPLMLTNFLSTPQGMYREAGVKARAFCVWWVCEVGGDGAAEAFLRMLGDDNRVRIPMINFFMSVLGTDGMFNGSEESWCLLEAVARRIGEQATEHSRTDCHEAVARILARRAATAAPSVAAFAAVCGVLAALPEGVVRAHEAELRGAELLVAPAGFKWDDVRAPGLGLGRALALAKTSAHEPSLVAAVEQAGNGNVYDDQALVLRALTVFGACWAATADLPDGEERVVQRLGAGIASVASRGVAKLMVDSVSDDAVVAAADDGVKEWRGLLDSLAVFLDVLAAACRRQPQDRLLAASRLDLFERGVAFMGDRAQGAVRHAAGAMLAEFFALAGGVASASKAATTAVAAAFAAFVGPVPARSDRGFASPRVVMFSARLSALEALLKAGARPADPVAVALRAATETGMARNAVFKAAAAAVERLVSLEGAAFSEAQTREVAQDLMQATEGEENYSVFAASKALLCPAMLRRMPVDLWEDEVLPWVKERLFRRFGGVSRFARLMRTAARAGVHTFVVSALSAATSVFHSISFLRNHTSVSPLGYDELQESGFYRCLTAVGQLEFVEMCMDPEAVPVHIARDAVVRMLELAAAVPAGYKPGSKDHVVLFRIWRFIVACIRSLPAEMAAEFAETMWQVLYHARHNVSVRTLQELATVSAVRGASEQLVRELIIERVTRDEAANEPPQVLTSALAVVTHLLLEPPLSVQDHAAWVCGGLEVVLPYCALRSIVRAPPPTDTRPERMTLHLQTRFMIFPRHFCSQGSSACYLRVLWTAG